MSIHSDQSRTQAAEFEIARLTPDEKTVYDQAVGKSANAGAPPRIVRLGGSLAANTTAALTGVPVPVSP
jgi:hypothetical protein